MSLFRKARPNPVDRRASLAGVPVFHAHVSLAAGQRGTKLIKLSRHRSERVSFFDRFRPAVEEKRHTLDELGSFVAEQIDGRRNVSAIIDAFVEHFRVNRREAELSVVAFIKMLMKRNIVAVVVDPAAKLWLLCASVVVAMLGGAAGAETSGVPGASDSANSRAAAPVPLPLREGLGEGRTGGDLLHQPNVIDQIQHNAEPSPNPSLEGKGVFDAAGIAGAVEASESWRAGWQLAAVEASRIAGGAANLELERRVAAAFESSGLAHGQITFETPCFKPGRTTLHVEGEPPVVLWPMHSTVLRPGNFDQVRFDTRLVYLGWGRPADLERTRGIELDGAIAVMEFDCGGQWMDLMRFGIKGFVFLAGQTYEHVEATLKVSTSEVAVPRFLVEANDTEKLRTALHVPLPCREGSGEGRSGNDSPHRRAGGDKTRAGEEPSPSPSLEGRGGIETPALSGTAKLVELTCRIDAARSYWRPQTLRNLWVLVPGSDPELGRQMVVVTAALDANGVAPSLAFGGKSAGNLALLMAMFDEFRRAPPARSVLFVAVNARTHHFLGDRLLARHLLAPPKSLNEQRDLLEQHMRRAQMYADYYSRLKLQPDTIEQDQTLIDQMAADLREQATGKQLIVKQPLQEHAKRFLNQVKTQIMATTQRDDLDDKQRQQRIDELHVHKAQYINVLKLFNKITVGGNRVRLHDLSAVETDILRGYLESLITKRRRWAKLNRDQLQRALDNDAVRLAAGGRQVAMVFALELNWDGGQLGFMGHNSLIATPKWSRLFGLNSTKVARRVAGELGLGGHDPFVDTLTHFGGFNETYYFPQAESSIGFFHGTSRTPAVSLRNTFAGPGSSFTPADTLSAIDQQQASATAAYVGHLSRALFDEPQIFAAEQLPPPATPVDTWSVQLQTFKLDEFSSKTIPEVEVGGSTVLVYRPLNEVLEPIVAGDVINAYFGVTDERGVCSVMQIRDNAALTMPTAAYQLDAGQVKVEHVIEAGRLQQEQIKSTITFAAATKLLPMFACRGFPIYARQDYSHSGLEPVTIQSLIALGGGRDSELAKVGALGIGIDVNVAAPATRGPASVFLERPLFGGKGETLKLLTGSSPRRIVLNATHDRPLGAGFASADELGPDMLARAAGDMGVLNAHRYQTMRGVANELIDELIQSGDEHYALMEQAAAERDRVGYLHHLYSALGRQGKAYSQLAGIRYDMLRAVVFFMALMVPFCFFLQKLLFNFVKIEAQMGVFFLLFVATYIVFRMIHPAFRIARTPEAIFVAFLLGAIGTFVILILHSRFQGEMQLLFAPLMRRHSAGYSATSQQAMLIGVGNMKRRRIRTTLTTATIVLVTFTMLTFTSVSKKLTPTIIPVAGDAPYTGLHFHWPGHATMDEATRQTFETMFEGEADVVVRRWLYPAGQSMNVQSAGGKSAAVEAVLGLSVMQEQLLAPLPLLPGGRALSSDKADEVIITDTAAKFLQIGEAEVGQATLVFEGRRLKVVGVVDGSRLLYIRDLDGLPLLPIRPGSLSALSMAGTGEASSDQADDEIGTQLVDPAKLLIVPVKTAAAMGAAPYSVSLRFADDAPLWPLIERALMATQAQFHIGSRQPFAAGAASKRTIAAGVYYIGSGYRTSIGGLNRLLIPLLIAGTIVLNTMLGSVFERKGEIAVYNAIGLNPTHIGLFFLAEAFVYGVLGSVGGYLIGQLLAISLQKLQLISDVNVNFSSVIVVYVIVFTIALVVLSTVYPAMVATRVAVPSGKRKWSMPPHDNDRMEVVFPFVYDDRLAVGVMKYVDEYFAERTEASFGELIASQRTVNVSHDAAGRATYELGFHVALSPYDLAVTQDVSFRAAYDETVDRYVLRTINTRVSGQDSNWVTTTTPFLERLRRYLIQWRNLDATRHEDYVSQGKAMFGGSGLVV